MTIYPLTVELRGENSIRPGGAIKPTSSMSGKPSFIAILCLLGLLSQAGCVALNIPSQRFHDTDDRGGPLGHLDGPRSLFKFHESDNQAPIEHCHQPAAPVCLDGGPLEADPFDSSLDIHGQPKPPEIPWPRFHPVPTRPVFGTTAGSTP